MKHKRTLFASVIIAVFLLAVPAPSYAASKATFFGPIVPAECKCENQTVQGGTSADTVNSAPDYGCVLQVVQNSINFGVTLAGIIFTLYLVITGLSFITSGGSSESRSAAKTRFMNVFVGLAVLLCAWLIIDYVMKTIYDDNGYFGPWNAILASDSSANRCIVSRQPDGITTGTLDILFGNPPSGTSSGGASGGGGGTGGNCTAIPESQLTSVGGYKLTTDTAKRFNEMKAAAARDGVTLTITSGYRSPDDQLRIWNSKNCHIVSGKTVCNSTTAAVPCSLGGSGSNHTRGTAVDISLNNGQYTWLKNHAATYGFYNKLSNDLFHWSDTGR